MRIMFGITNLGKKISNDKNYKFDGKNSMPDCYSNKTSTEKNHD